MKVAAGTVFEVVLDHERSGLGMVLAMGRNDTGAFCFFDKAVAAPAALDDAVGLSPENILYILKTGTVEFDRGVWKKLGPLKNWDRDEWPPMVFGREAVLSDDYFVNTYHPDDPGRQLSSVVAPREVVEKLPRDGIWSASTGAAWLREHLGVGDIPVKEELDDSYALRISFTPTAGEAPAAGFHGLVSRIESVLADSPVGELDGYETGEDEATLFFEGPHGSKILAAVHPFVKSVTGWTPAIAIAGDRKRRMTKLTFDSQKGHWVSKHSDLSL